VKNLKGKFTPKHIQLRNKEGRLVRLEKRADAIADYLEQEHWQNPVEEGGTRTINQRKLQTLLNKEIQKAPFTWEELHSCIKLTKKKNRTGEPHMLKQYGSIHRIFMLKQYGSSHHIFHYLPSP
jgi:hypothetical protein